MLVLFLDTPLGYKEELPNLVIVNCASLVFELELRKDKLLDSDINDMQAFFYIVI
ncbi:hypothetical protein Lalb_Chr18g0048361 [Lupinus albus]|uniref:Uncharacterized protein n=1 Tax=Lupinus albus TaxID=3870 RepID=A0A6A4NX53_LUPAL|nr:hypothetical protein Lalb_Chr18g0048361 [Lupinus albus]